MRAWRQIRPLRTDSYRPPRASPKPHTTMSQPQKYIVVFKKDATQEQIDKYACDVGDNGGEVTNRYTDVLKGFAAKIPDSFLQSLQGDDIIDYIEPDGVVTTQ